MNNGGIAMRVETEERAVLMAGDERPAKVILDVRGETHEFNSFILFGFGEEEDGAVYSQAVTQCPSRCMVRAMDMLSGFIRDSIKDMASSGDPDQLMEAISLMTMVGNRIMELRSEPNRREGTI